MWTSQSKAVNETVSGAISKVCMKFVCRGLLYFTFNPQVQ